jgi:hypothetical protein
MSSTFCIFPSTAVEATMNLNAPFREDTPDWQREGSIHPSSTILGEVRGVIEGAIRHACAGWSEEEVEREVARHLGANKWLNIAVGRARVFSVVSVGAMETSAPKPSTVKEMLSYAKVRIWTISGTASTYPARVGVFERGVSLKATQVICEYPACLDYAFAKK